MTDPTALAGLFGLTPREWGLIASVGLPALGGLGTGIYAAGRIIFRLGQRDARDEVSRRSAIADNKRRDRQLEWQSRKMIEDGAKLDAVVEALRSRGFRIEVAATDPPPARERLATLRGEDPFEEVVKEARARFPKDRPGQ